MSKLSDVFSKIKPLLSDKRVLAAIAGVLVLGASIIVMARRDSRVTTGKDPDKASDITGDELLPGEGGEPIDAAGTPGGLGGSASRSTNSSATGARPGVGVSVPKTGTIPPGVDYANQTIKVVYYWKDDSQNSQFLRGTSGEAVDDWKAFDALVRFVDKHRKGSAELMGSKINMGNWKILPTEIVMNNTDQINSGTTKIVKEIKPFAAITGRGSLGTETCPALAAARIFNYATLQPYMTNLDEETNGYCIPNAISWSQQIDATVNYMKWHKSTTFTSVDRPGHGKSCPTGCPRVYGFVYTEYPGLNKQSPLVVSKLRAAGLNIPDSAVASLPVGLTTAAGQAPAVRDRLAAAGVNTVIMPDGGSSLAFTHGAGDWRPDYYVWPCSGQDTTGYTRLLPPAQWDNASGLSCYDDRFDPDLTIDSDDKNGQWYKAFKEMSSQEAPSSTHLIYAALQPLVEGVSRLGSRDFTVENYRAALNEFDPYRYHGDTGRTTAADNMLVLLGNGEDNSLWGDLARVTWSPAAQNPYTYTDGHRYKSNQSFP